ncbi:MAG: PorT family protein [Bacteroidetes bacterium]|nr:PorT family protein [Bacteroidota bacterium]
MKKITSLFLVMIFSMSIMAQMPGTLNEENFDAITSKASVDTVILKVKDKTVVEKQKFQADNQKKHSEGIIDPLPVDSSENNMHVKVKGKDVVIIQNEDGTTRVNVSHDEKKKKVTLHVDSDADYNYNYSNSDTTRIRIGKKKFMIIDDGDNNQIFFENDDSDNKKKFKGHYSGFDIGINNYFTSEFSTSLPANEEYMNLNSGKSWGVNINLIQKSIGLFNNNIGLVTGMGLEFNNYRFDNKQLVIAGDSTVLYSYKETERNYEKNKLATTYLTVPLIMEFQIPVREKNKSIYLSLGVTGSIKLGSHVKLEEKSGNKEKIRDDFNLSPLRYGLTARVGYDDFGIFANYSLQQMFEKNKGPELYPFTIGFSFICF